MTPRTATAILLRKFAKEPSSLQTDCLASIDLDIFSFSCAIDCEEFVDSRDAQLCGDASRAGLGLGFDHRYLYTLVLVLLRMFYLNACCLKPTTRLSKMPSAATHIVYMALHDKP